MIIKTITHNKYKNRTVVVITATDFLNWIQNIGCKKCNIICRRENQHNAALKQSVEGRNRETETTACLEHTHLPSVEDTVRPNPRCLHPPESQYDTRDHRAANATYIYNGHC